LRVRVRGYVLGVTREAVLRLLARLEARELDAAQAAEELARLPFRELGDARLDTHRALRQGVPEVVFGPGKSAEQIVRIARSLAEYGGNVLVTRVEPRIAAEVTRALPEFSYHPVPRLLAFEQQPRRSEGRGTIAVLCAGTSDLSVAEEAALVAELLGNKVERVYDVGVAGLHRVLGVLDLLRAASVLIVVAGMEGALPSVVAGLVEAPVIAVPTRQGYGAAFEGLAALLGMLSSCASNVAVVNIDNGFGAAFVASRINRV
jgi:hypothetical protein